MKGWQMVVWQVYVHSSTLILKHPGPIENIQVYGDTAVVTGNVKMDAIVEGKPKLLNSRYTNVWIKGTGIVIRVASLKVACHAPPIRARSAEPQRSGHS